MLDSIGKFVWWRLLLAALFGVMVNIYATTVTTVGSDPWVWQAQNLEAKWMRVLGPLFCGWLGCLQYVLVSESFRLSLLSKDIEAFDLLNLQPYQPLIKQGLTNVLVVVAATSIVALFLFEPGFDNLLIQLSIPLAVFAWIGLMLPLNGIRRKIKQAKAKELDWCNQALLESRTRFKAGAETKYSLAEVIAYKNLIEEIRNWPFENPTLVRFALYLLIPLGSMFGGAVFERGLDMLLN